MDSFGFAAESFLCCGGTRKAKRLKNAPRWVSVPIEDVPKLRYRDLYRLKSGHIVVQNVLGETQRLDKVVPKYLLHLTPPE